MAHVPDAHIQITKCLQNLPDDQQAPSLSAAVPHIWTDLPGSTRPPKSHTSAKLPKRFVDLSGTRVMGSSLDPQQPPAAAAAMCNSFINPVWFMPRNGLMNGLDPTAVGLATPPTSALIYPNPLGQQNIIIYYSEP